MIGCRKSKKATSLLLSILLVVLSPWAYCTEYSSSYRSEYDEEFKSQSARWMQGYDWRLLKAQCIQESRLNPDAVSSAGAEGLCQFMPTAWSEVQRKFGTNAQRTVARESIRGAAWYMHRMIRNWDRRERTRIQVFYLAAASYNAGLGTVLKSQKRCDDGRLFEELFICLPAETQLYPIHIQRHYLRLYKWEFSPDS